MPEQPIVARLSQIASRWSLVRPGPEAPDARARADLLVHYHEAVYHYLLAKLRDPHTAGELFSNFAVRVLEGDALIRHADPTRGRFRDYLRTVLSRMVIDHYRRLGRQPTQRLNEQDVPDQTEPDADFDRCWRQELLNQTWKALQAAEGQCGQPFATVIRLKEEQPELRSQQLAEQLAEKLGRPFTAAGVRQVLHRGRDLFGDLLVAEAARSLRKQPGEAVSAERVERELIELGLLFSYCKDALTRYVERG